MEIEKKYLIRQLPELSGYKKHEIEQGYLCRNPVLRIRKKDDEYIFTYKSKLKGRSAAVAINDEVERPLTKKAYELLREKTEGYLIRKTRYLIPLSAEYAFGTDESDKPLADWEDNLEAKEGSFPTRLTIELDVFHDRLEGLIFAEIEFPDEVSALRFSPPEWFGADVSADKRYRNGFLSEQDSLHAIFGQESE